MSKSAPLPGSEARLNPAIVGQRDRGGRMQPALFHARDRRLERFVRAGVTFVDNVGLFVPSASIASPVTLVQSQNPGILIARFEHFGVPTGVIFETGDAVFNSTLQFNAGDLELDITSESIAEVSASTPLDSPDTGFHTYVFAVDPDPAGDNSLPLRAQLWLDGRLIFDELGVTTADPDVAWASSTADWGYASTMTNVGQIADLELYLGQLPALF